MLPRAKIQMMPLHLEEISRIVAVNARGVVLMDRAGRHKTGNPKVPKNLTIIPPPSYDPELNPVENIWLHLRQTWLSNCVSAAYDAKRPPA